MIEFLQSWKWWQSLVKGLAITTVIYIFSRIIARYKSKLLLNWRTCKSFWSISKRLNRSGVSNFFSCRSDYTTYRKEQSINEYVQTSQRRLIYVGFWLAQAVELGHIENAFRSLLEEGCTIELVFIDPDAKPIYFEKIAKYLDVDPENIQGRVESVWKNMIDFKKDLPAKYESNFELYKHTEMLNASAFIFDYNTEHAKTLIDIKFFDKGRQNSLGLELRPEGDLYYRVTESFLGVKRHAESYS